jgi:hypothetical protein
MGLGSKYCVKSYNLLKIITTYYPSFFLEISSLNRLQSSVILGRFRQCIFCLGEGQMYGTFYRATFPESSSRFGGTFGSFFFIHIENFYIDDQATQMKTD